MATLARRADAVEKLLASMAGQPCLEEVSRLQAQAFMLHIEKASLEESADLAARLSTMSSLAARAPMSWLPRR